jgi:hypothetical protein
MNVIISPISCAMRTAPHCAVSSSKPRSEPSGSTAHASRTWHSCFDKVSARSRSDRNPAAPASVANGRRSLSHTHLIACTSDMSDTVSSLSKARSCLARFRVVGVSEHRIVSSLALVWSPEGSLAIARRSGWSKEDTFLSVVGESIEQGERQIGQYCTSCRKRLT